MKFVPVLTDIHESYQSLVAPVVDVLQIPAFLSPNWLTPWQQQLQVELSRMLKFLAPLGHEACCPQAGIRRNQTDSFNRKGHEFWI